MSQPKSACMYVHYDFYLCTVLVRLLLFNERLPHSVGTKVFGNMSYFKYLILVLVFVPALVNGQISPVICLNQGTGECYKVILW